MNIFLKLKKNRNNIKKSSFAYIFLPKLRNLEKLRKNSKYKKRSYSLKFFKISKNEQMSEK